MPHGVKGDGAVAYETFTLSNWRLLT